VKPGRELDALVAEKVMGWRWFRFLNKCYLIPPRNTETGFDPASVLSHWDGEGKQGTPDLEWTTLTSYPNFRLRHYSTDIAAAWEVVEKMRADNYTVEVYSPGALINDEHGVHSIGWGVEFSTWGKPSRPSGRVGRTIDLFNEESEREVIDTAPHAICLAALKAVEVPT
jgi:hypothetical protein